MQQLGTMMQQALQDQVAPTLQQMMIQQAKVESRLEQLEVNSRMGSVDGDLMERTRLLNLSGALGATPDMARTPDAVSSWGKRPQCTGNPSTVCAPGEC